MKQFSIVIAGGGSTYTPDMLEMLCLVREHFSASPGRAV